jgi:hypothetical protein
MYHGSRFSQSSEVSASGQRVVSTYSKNAVFRHKDGFKFILTVHGFLKPEKYAAKRVFFDTCE